MIQQDTAHSDLKLCDSSDLYKDISKIGKERLKEMRVEFTGYYCSLAWCYELKWRHNVDGRGNGGIRWRS